VRPNSGVKPTPSYIPRINGAVVSAVQTAFQRSRTSPRYWQTRRMQGRFDARNVGGQSYVTAVKDQGSCGSCVAFGSLGAMETTAAFTQGQPDLGLDLSEAHLFYTHGGAAGVTCDTGWMQIGRAHV